MYLSGCDKVPEYRGKISVLRENGLPLCVLFKNICVYGTFSIYICYLLPAGIECGEQRQIKGGKEWPVNCRIGFR